MWTPPARVPVGIVALEPVKAVGFAGGVAVPSIQVWPPVTPVPASLAATAIEVLAVPKAIVLGLRVTPPIVGAALSMTRTVVAVPPQLPAASLPWT